MKKEQDPICIQIPNPLVRVGDPDLYQNVTDLEHWPLVYLLVPTFHTIHCYFHLHYPAGILISVMQRMFLLGESGFYFLQLAGFMGQKTSF
jgi:hypothetical protein